MFFVFIHSEPEVPRRQMRIKHRTEGTCPMKTANLLHKYPSLNRAQIRVTQRRYYYKTKFLEAIPLQFLYISKELVSCLSASNVGSFRKRRSP